MAAPPVRPRRMPRLAGLDDLRALAVVGVVLYHLDLPWIPGGFLDVDVFFVDVVSEGGLKARDEHIRAEAVRV